MKILFVLCAAHRMKSNKSYYIFFVRLLSECYVTVQQQLCALNNQLRACVRV